MLRLSRIAAGIALAGVASCQRAAKTQPPPESVGRPLAGYAALRLVLAPTAHVRDADSLGWVQQLGGARVVARRLDTAIVAVLDQRGVRPRWIMPSELARTYERNRTYAADPYQLVVEGLRGPAFRTGDKFGEPLSSQLRTMIALQDDARYVVLPVDLRFDRDGRGGAARAVLRVALLDPRSAEARWVGEVKSDASTRAGAALSGVATRLADLFVAP